MAEFFTRRLGRRGLRPGGRAAAGRHPRRRRHPPQPAATFPRFVDMERDHGGLVRAALATGSKLPTGAGARRRSDAVRQPCAAGPGRARRGAGRAGFGATPGGRPFFATGMAELSSAGRAGSERSATAAHDRGGRPGVDGGYEVVLRRSGTAGRRRRPGHPGAGHRPAAAARVPGGGDPAGRDPARLDGHRLLGLPGDDSAAARPATASSSPGPRAATSWPPPGVPASGRAGPPPGQVLVRGYVGGIGREAVLDSRRRRPRRTSSGPSSAPWPGSAGTPVHAEVHRYPLGNAAVHRRAPRPGGPRSAARWPPAPAWP